MFKNILLLPFIFWSLRSLEQNQSACGEVIRNFLKFPPNTNTVTETNLMFAGTADLHGLLTEATVLECFGLSGT